MASLRPHRHFNFVGLWKYGFALSGIMIVLAIAGLIASFALTGSALTLGTEFSGGTSIQINDVGDVTEDQIREAFESAVADAGVETELSSVQTSSSTSGGNGFILKTADTDSNDIYPVMTTVEESLSIPEGNVQVETIGASWGASVISSALLAFIISCVAILIVIAARYREPRMGVTALITLFHDLIIIIGIYAWAGIFMHLEVTADVIAALLAIVGYSLYDTIVIFHRIDQNASPNMRMSMKTCTNNSVNQVIMRSLNTSITSILPVLFMLILGTDTLRDFAFAMFCGMVIGLYSTVAISSPIYTLWKIHDPKYKRLEEKYPYEVQQSPYPVEQLKADRKASKQAQRDAKKAAKAEKAEAAKAAAAAKKETAKPAEAPAAKEEAPKTEEAPKEEAAEVEEAPQAEEATKEAAVPVEEAAEEVAASVEEAAEEAAPEEAPEKE